MLIDGTKALAAGLWRMSLPWKAWLSWLFVLNAIVPLFFFDELLAKVTLLAFMAAPVIGVILAAKTGFTRILGLMHFGWFAYIPFAILRSGEIYDPSYKPWLYATLATNGACLAIDVVDVFRYLRGERAPVFGTFVQVVDVDRKRNNIGDLK